MLIDRPRTVAAIATFARLTAHRSPGPVQLRARGADVAGIGPALIVAVEGATSVPAEERVRALEPFSPWPGDGLGLALPLARRVLELHGGRVEVAEPGSTGAAWTLILPVGRTIHRRGALGTGRARAI